MVDAFVGLGLELLVYAGILVAVPLWFVLLFRAIDYLALDEVTEQYARNPQEWQVHADQFVDDSDGHVDRESTTQDVDGGIDDGVPCPRCGSPNESDYTFCRSCQARIQA